AHRAASAASAPHRGALIDAHAKLVKLAAEAPSYNFDTGLLALEIGTLLVAASPSSEHAHGTA
ncbi:MAG: DNA polymerase III subunit delta', partial [Pseudomonadota bacterium]